MITGAHSIIYSTDPQADRRFFRDVLKLTHVDAGAGWLIFGLPPAELAVHPGEKNDVQELYLLCHDVAAFVAAMKKRRRQCTPGERLKLGSADVPDVTWRREARCLRAATPTPQSRQAKGLIPIDWGRGCSPGQSFVRSTRARASVCAPETSTGTPLYG